MEIPSAVWVVELVNSAPVISHTGADWWWGGNYKGGCEGGGEAREGVRVVGR